MANKFLRQNIGSFISIAREHRMKQVTPIIVDEEELAFVEFVYERAFRDAFHLLEEHGFLEVVDG